MAPAFLAAVIFAAAPLFGLPAAAEEKPPIALRNLRPRACPNEYFAPANAQHVPACPMESGNRLLPNTYPPRAVFVGFAREKSFLRYLNDLVETVESHERDITLNILIPGPDVEYAYRAMRRLLRPPYSEFVNLIPTPAAETFWLQDYFEIAVSLSDGRGAIYDLPYENRRARGTSPALALRCQMDMISGPPDSLMLTTQPRIGDNGGNIEAFPGGFLVVGDSMSEEARRRLEHTFGQTPRVVRTAWMVNRHVDMLYAVLPAPRETAPCGFVLARASPGLALDLIRAKDFSRGGPGPDSPVRPKRRPGPKLEDFAPCWRDGGGKAEPKLCAALTRANETYEAVIAEDARELLHRMRESTGCSEIPEIRLPQLFAPAGDFPTYGLARDAAQVVNPSAVNGLSLGRTYLLPRQPHPIFQQAVDEALKPLQLRLVYGDGAYPHLLHGGFHCTANVARQCRPKNP